MAGLGVWVWDVGLGGLGHGEYGEEGAESTGHGVVAAVAWFPFGCGPLEVLKGVGRVGVASAEVKGVQPPVAEDRELTPCPVWSGGFGVEGGREHDGQDLACREEVAVVQDYCGDFAVKCGLECHFDS